MTAGRQLSLPFTATFPLHDVDLASSGALAPHRCKLCLSGWCSPRAWVSVAPQGAPSSQTRGGDRRDRTDDLMLAKHALSQLSYVPENQRTPEPSGSQGRRAAAPRGADKPEGTDVPAGA